MHEFKQKMESDFDDGITISLQAGTLDIRSQIAGYSIILLNNKNDISDGRVIYRKYNDEESGFEVWSCRGKNGVFNFSTENRSTFDSRKFSKISEALLETIDLSLIFNIGVKGSGIKTLSSMYIEPNFEVPSFYGVSASSKKRIKSSSDFDDAECSAIVFGGKDVGKSYLLKYLYVRGLKKQVDGDYSNFVFFIDLDDIVIKNKNSIMNEVCSQYYTKDIGTSFEDKIKSMVSRGNATFYIDNLSLKDESKVQFLSEFICDNDTCQFIFSADIDDGPRTSSHISDICKSKINLVSIGVLKRKDVRKIVEKWVPTLPIQCENNIYNEVTKIINSSQLPHNYFIYTMLLSIYENNQDVNDILSEADVVENFIEMLLRKNRMDIPRGKPQYKVLLHFMGYVSTRLFYEGKSERVLNDIYGDALEFNRLTMHSYNVTDYIDPLCASGILNKKGDVVCFSQITFYYYFLSYYMSHDKKLKDDILSDFYYLKFDKVVEYFASQHTSDFLLLDFISEKVELTKEILSKDIFIEKNINIAELDFENLGDISILDVASSVSEIEEKIIEIESDRDRDDERLDKISPLKSESDIDAYRDDEFLCESDFKLRRQLSLYSRIFRNTELVMEPQEILKVFSDIVDGYIFITKYTITQLDEQFLMPLIKPIIDEHISDKDISDEEMEKIMEDFRTVLSIVRAAMPNHFQNVMSYDLSTRQERIKNIVKASADDAPDNVSKSLLLYLLMDMDDSKIIENVKKIMKMNTSFSNSTLFFKLMQMLSGKYNLSKSDSDFLKTTANKLITLNRAGLKGRLELFNKVLGIN